MNEAVEATETGEFFDEYDCVIYEMSAAVYSADVVNVRARPSTESDIIGKFYFGDVACITGRTDNGWYRIEYNGQTAFVYADYFTAQNPYMQEEIKIPENYYFRSEDDYFFIVSKEIFLPDGYSIKTSCVQGAYELETVAAAYCRAMIAAAKADGIDLKILSAYRSIDYQRNLFERGVNSRMKELGMSYDEAYYDTSVNIATPGGSEHNAGLAADIIDCDHWDTYEEFENTAEFRWLIKHCAEYGFILRYPKGKDDITGYIYEPWHFRFVGVKYAADVMNSGLCLEEYFEHYGY